MLTQVLSILNISKDIENSKTHSNRSTLTSRKLGIFIYIHLSISYFSQNESSCGLSKSPACSKKKWLRLHSLKAYCAPIQTASVDPVQVHRMTSVIPFQIKLIDIRARTKSKRNMMTMNSRGEDSALMSSRSHKEKQK